MIRLDSMVRIPLRMLRPEQTSAIKDVLTLRPPVSSGVYGKAKNLYAYRVENGDLCVPRQSEAARDILRLNDWEDHRILGAPIDVEWKGVYRTGQKAFKERAVARLGERSDGLGCAGCGFGKTVVGTSIIAAMNTTTIIGTHKKDLIRQWKKALKTFTGIDAGLVQGGKCDWKDRKVVIATFQSLHQKTYEPEFYRNFGLLVADECLTGDSLVRTDTGLVELRAIPSSGAKSVLSFNENEDRWEWRDIVRWVPKGEQPVVLVTTEKGTVRCTADHLIRTERGWVQAIDLVMDDRILSPVSVDAEQGSLSSAPTAAPADLSSKLTGRLLAQGWNTSSTRVFSVEKRGVEEVYDIEVEGNHNFVANGLLVHNCHRVSAPTFSSAVSKFPTRYRLGLTATPERSDGMTDAFYWHLGRILAEGYGEFLDCIVYRMNTREQWMPPESDYFWRGQPHLSKLTTALTQVVPRTELIVRTCVNAAKAGRRLLVLSHRVNHCKEIVERLRIAFLMQQLPYTSGHYASGSTKKAEAAQIDAAACTVSVATHSMAAEGLDVPDKDTLVLATPAANVEQACGRIRRLYFGKKAPMVITLVDPIGICLGLYGKQRKYYLAEGHDKSRWEIKTV